MNRKQRREFEHDLKKRKDVIEKRKSNLRKTHGHLFNGDPFEQINEYKKYGPFTIVKNGLKVAPSVTYKLWGMMLRFNYDYIAFAVFGYVLKLRKRLKEGQKRIELAKSKTSS